MWFSLCRQGAQQGDRRQQRVREGSDGVETSEARREIKVADERGGIKRGMPTEQKRKVKREKRAVRWWRAQGRRWFSPGNIDAR